MTDRDQKGALIVPQWWAGIIAALTIAAVAAAATWAHHIDQTVTSHDQRLYDMDGRLDRIDTKLDSILEHLIRSAEDGR